MWRCVYCGDKNDAAFLTCGECGKDRYVPRNPAVFAFGALVAAVVGVVAGFGAMTATHGGGVREFSLTVLLYALTAFLLACAVGRWLYPWRRGKAVVPLMTVIGVGLVVWSYPWPGYARVLLPTDFGATGVAFTPDGRMLAVAMRYRVFLWDTRHPALAPIQEFCTTGEVFDLIRTVACSPDGATIAYIADTGDTFAPRGYGQETQLCDCRTRLACRTMYGTGAGLAFSADGRFLACPGKCQDGLRTYTVSIWDLAAGRIARAFQVPAMTRDCSLTSCGRFLATLAPKTTDLWDAQSGRRLRTLRHLAEDAVGVGTHLAFSPDGSALAVGFDHGEIVRAKVGFEYVTRLRQVTLWDTVTGRAIRVFRGADMPAFSPDGRWLAAGGRNELPFWDARTGARGAILARYGAKVGPVAFSPDGSLLAACVNGAVMLWRTQSVLPG